MVKLRKFKELKTVEEGVTLVIRAVPNKLDANKNFYIADVITRTETDTPGESRVKLETKTFAPTELKKELGIDSKEQIRVY